MITKGIQSTRKVPQVVEDNEPEPHPDLITGPTSNFHDVFVHCIKSLLFDDCNNIVIDLQYRYPDTTYDGHKYIYVMHDIITNCINARGLASRRAPGQIWGFEEYV